MKRTTIAILPVILFLNFSGKAQSSVSIVPVPVSMQMGNGNFILNASSVIEVSATDADSKRVAGFLNKKLSGATGYAVPVRSVTSFQMHLTVSGFLCQMIKRLVRKVIN